MKIRQGFVSNSSTTSFCIYGVVTNVEDLFYGFVNLLKTGVITQNDMENIFEGITDFEKYDNDANNFSASSVEELLSKLDCDFMAVYHSYNDTDQFFIGRPPQSLKDDEYNITIGHYFKYFSILKDKRFNNVKSKFPKIYRDLNEK